MGNADAFAATLLAEVLDALLLDVFFMRTSLAFSCDKLRRKQITPRQWHAPPIWSPRKPTVAAMKAGFTDVKWSFFEPDNAD
jgi:hypothetical protein